MAAVCGNFGLSRANGCISGYFMHFGAKCSNHIKSGVINKVLQYLCLKHKWIEQKLVR